VVECPLCGAETAETAAHCPTCGLAVSLYGPLREELEAAEEPPPPEGQRVFPEVLQLVHELGGGLPPAAGPAAVAQPARFPATEVPVPRAPSTLAPPIPPDLPAVGSGDREAVLERDIEEFRLLARRLGVDLSLLEAPIADAERAKDVEALEELRKNLFVRDAAFLAAALDHTLARRNELSGFTGTPTIDEALEHARRAFSRGDLFGAHRALQRATTELEAGEEEWMEVKVLTVEAEFLVETIRDLGGDASPVVAPLAAARRWARDGETERVEQALARSILALWRLASPLVLTDLQRIRSTLASATKEDGDLRAARASLQEMASALKVRNFTDTILAYRSAKEAADRIAGGGGLSGGAPGAGLPAASRLR
jgi:hypothetical protein